MLILEPIRARIQKMEPALWLDIINMPEVPMISQICKLILLGYAEKTLPLLTEQSKTAIQPNLTPPARRELLKKLGLIEGNGAWKIDKFPNPVFVIRSLSRIN